MATITASATATTLNPVMVVDYAIDRQTRNVLLDTLGTPYPTTFLREALSKSGTLSLLFLGHEAADEAQTVLSSRDRFTFSEPAVDEQWDFVVSGNVTKRNQGGTPYWLVSAEVREVESL